ncbi:MAG: heavy-metal-associated domain-containing protein [Magnetococcales bacterium]|nr:heavy-metal-associated domain-containing protein [Magnetococcales bacterium]
MIVTRSPRLVTRCLKLARPSDPGCETRIREVLEGREGIYRVDVLPLRHQVAVTYDLCHLRLATIEGWLGDAGFSLDVSIIPRLHRQWVHFTEENEANHQAHLPHCCNKPPVNRRTAR